MNDESDEEWKRRREAERGLKDEVPASGIFIALSQSGYCSRGKNDREPARS
jgi:hypothetical protein